MHALLKFLAYDALLSRNIFTHGCDSQGLSAGTYAKLLRMEKL